MAKLKVSNRFATVPNEVLNMAGLSMKAKGLFAYIQSKTDGWNFSAEGIAQQSLDGISSIRSGLRELENAGLLIRKKQQNDNGYWEIEYILQFSEICENPMVENPTSENPTLENYANNSNTILSKKDISNKEYLYSKFYDAELKKSESDLNYETFIKFIFGENELGEPLTNVLKLKQVTYEQFKELWNKKMKYGISLSHYLVQMENYKPLTKNNQYVSRTLHNWINRDLKK